MKIVDIHFSNRSISWLRVSAGGKVSLVQIPWKGNIEPSENTCTYTIKTIYKAILKVKKFEERNQNKRLNAIQKEHPLLEKMLAR